MIEYLNPWIQALNEYFEKDKYLLEYDNEYLTLLREEYTKEQVRRDVVITQGESEVIDRIKCIARESFIDLPELDTSDDLANDFW